MSNVILRNPVSHPLFVRLVARLRAPKGTTVGACRRIRFDNIEVSGADGRYPCGVQGIPDAPVMDVSFSDVHVVSSGGGTAEDAARIPKEKREARPGSVSWAPCPPIGFMPGMYGA